MPMTRCTRCVLDTSVPEIRFDEQGICNYCLIHDEQEKLYPSGTEGEARLEEIANQIRKTGAGRAYDCIVGVSGGRDSTYTLWKAVDLGLRPLAVHFDNGWNSETAVRNIQRATEKLGVDLHTVVADWEEFKDLQIAFLRASVPDAETPTDYAIYSVLYTVAKQAGVKFFLQGHSFRTEGTSPIGWTYMDGRYLRSVHRTYGTGRIRSFPILSASQLLYYSVVRGIREVRLLAYCPYDQGAVTAFLTDELGWEYYGGHHHESTYTEFFQSYLLPTKFGIDKRKTELSALIRSGQITRETALEVLRTPYEYDPEVIKYVRSKLGIDEAEFEHILSAPTRSFLEFPTYHSTIRRLRPFVRAACSMGVLPHIFYLKYGTSWE